MMFSSLPTAQERTGQDMQSPVSSPELIDPRFNHMRIPASSSKCTSFPTATHRRIKAEKQQKAIPNSCCSGIFFAYVVCLTAMLPFQLLQRKRACANELLIFPPVLEFSVSPPRKEPPKCRLAASKGRSQALILFQCCIAYFRPVSLNATTPPFVAPPEWLR